MEKTLAALTQSVYHFGAEAQENNFGINEYTEDFCILVGVKRWLDIHPDLKAEITKAFKSGYEANKKARLNYDK